MGTLGKGNTFASKNPLSQSRMRGQNLTRQVAPDASFPLSVPVDDAWPNRLNRFTGSCKGETMSSALCPSIVRKFLMYRCGRDLVLELEGEIRVPPTRCTPRVGSALNPVM